MILKKLKEKKKVMSLIAMSLMLTLANLQVAYADGPEYAHNAATWISGQLVWVAIIAILIALAFCIAKRNLIGAITTVLFGAVVVFIIANPEKIKSMGESIGNVIIK